MLSKPLLKSIRRQFPILKKKIYVNSCAKGALSLEIKKEAEKFFESWETLGAPWDLWLDKIDDARNEFANLIGAKSDEIAVTFCVSSGINAIASSLEYKKRNKILLNNYEFPTVVHIWSAQRKLGAKVKQIKIDNYENFVNIYQKNVDDKTLLVPVNHISQGEGVLAPIKELAKVCHSKGAYLFVDAYHTCGVIPIDVKRLDIDFLITGTMKYLLGIPGFAFLYVRDKLISNLKPLHTGWFGQKDPFIARLSGLKYDPTARRFESGLQSVIGAYTSVPGLKMIQKIGIENIEKHVSELVEIFLAGIARLKPVIVTPSDEKYRGPLVALKAKNATKLLKKLESENVIASKWKDNIRISFHFYNNRQDVKAVIKALEKNRQLLY